MAVICARLTLDGYSAVSLLTWRSRFPFKIRRFKNVLILKPHALFFVKMKDQNYENSQSHVSFSMTGIERYVAASVR